MVIYIFVMEDHSGNSDRRKDIQLFLKTMGEDVVVPVVQANDADGEELGQRKSEEKDVPLVEVKGGPSPRSTDTAVKGAYETAVKKEGRRTCSCKKSASTTLQERSPEQNEDNTQRLRDLQHELETYKVRLAEVEKDRYELRAQYERKIASLTEQLSARMLEKDAF